MSLFFKRRRGSVFFVFFFCLYFSSPVFSKKLTAGIEGQIAPEFPDLNWIDEKNRPIKPVKIKNLRGKVVYLNFFQSWCPGCLASGLPTLKKLSEHYRQSKKVVFLAVQTVFEGFGVNTKKKIYEIKKQFLLNVPLAHDDGSALGLRSSALMRSYKSRGTPWTVIIDQRGKVVYNAFHIQPKKAFTIIENLLEIKANKNKSIQHWTPKEGLTLLGSKAPQLQNLEWLQGGPQSLKALKGKLVLLRFWLSHCPYCTRSAKALNVFWQKYKDKGLVIIGIHHPKSNEGKKRSTVKKSIQSLEFKFPIAMDNTWQTIQSYGVNSLFKKFTSLSFLIDKKGIIRFVHDGGEYHTGGGPEHRDCNLAYYELEKKINEFL